jgi:RNA polymerase sigma factor (sigma-70 family)
MIDINALYEKALHGDRIQEEEFFSILTVRFRLIAGHRIRNVEDAEDVVQESLAVICREFRNTAIHTSFAAWAYEVLRHRMLSYFEKRNTRRSKLESLDEIPLISDEALADDASDLKTSLIDCLMQIGGYNIRYARILNLHHQGYDTEEICGKLNISPGNFYLILCRARILLDKCLRGKGYYGRQMQ